MDLWQHWAKLFAVHIQEKTRIDDKSLEKTCPALPGLRHLQIYSICVYFLVFPRQVIYRPSLHMIKDTFSVSRRVWVLYGFVDIYFLTSVRTMTMSDFFRWVKAR